MGLRQEFDAASIQTYLGIIACVLIALWTGRKPNLPTHEVICRYFTALANEEELLAHIERLALQCQPTVPSRPAGACCCAHPSPWRASDVHASAWP